MATAKKGAKGVTGGAGGKHGRAKTTPFLLPPEGCEDYGKSRFVILPVPYEYTTTYGKGAANGPAAVLDASTQVEFYDEEIRLEPYRAGISTAPAVTTRLDGRRAADAIEKAAAGILADGKRFIAIGGEHTLTLGLARAALARHPKAAIVHVDAHADLRDEYEHTKYGHGTVMRRLFDDGARIFQAGIRALSIEEARFIDANPTRIRTYFAKDIVGKSGWIDDMVAQLPEEVYLSFDVDGLDPSVAPGTGTPEPGGLSWYEATALIHAVARSARIVSADFVEVSPIKGTAATEFAVARLIHKTIGYICAADGILQPMRQGSL